jgi:CRP-like cAMP-binding protein
MTPSIAALRRALELQPGDVDARKQLARLHYRDGDVASAVRETLNAARILMHGSQHAEALRCCREALAVAPENTEARLVLAQIHARMPSLDGGPRVASPQLDSEPVFDLSPQHRISPSGNVLALTSSGNYRALDHAVEERETSRVAMPGTVERDTPSGAFEVVEQQELPPLRVATQPPAAPVPRAGRNRDMMLTPIVGELAIGEDVEDVSDEDDSSAWDAGPSFSFRDTPDERTLARTKQPTDAVPVLNDVRRSPANPFLDDPGSGAAGRRSLGPAEIHIAAEELPQHPMLATLSTASLTRLLENLELVEYTADAVVLEEGEVTDRLLFVHSGLVYAEPEGQLGKRELPECTAGAAVGLFEFFSGAPVRATVTAAAPTRCLELRAERADVLVRNDPQLAEAVARAHVDSMTSALLERAPLFQSLSDDQRGALRSAFVPVDVQPGEVVLKRGAINRRLFVLLEGQMVIDSRGAERPFGRMPLVPGDFFGFVSTVLGRAVQVAVVATDHARLLVLPEQEVYRLVAANKGVARAARREAVERGDVPISVHQLGGHGGFSVRRPDYG